MSDHRKCSITHPTYEPSQLGADRSVLQKAKKVLAYFAHNDQAMCKTCQVKRRTHETMLSSLLSCCSSQLPCWFRPVAERPWRSAPSWTCRRWWSSVFTSQSEPEGVAHSLNLLCALLASASYAAFTQRSWICVADLSEQELSKNIYKLIGIKTVGVQISSQQRSYHDSECLHVPLVLFQKREHFVLCPQYTGQVPIVSCLLKRYSPQEQMIQIMPMMRFYECLLPLIMVQMAVNCIDVKVLIKAFLNRGLKVS